MKLAFEGDNFSVGVLLREIRAVWQTFEVVFRPGIALCLPITYEGRIVLVQQYRVAVDQTLFEFPAGRLDEGEDAERAVRRELLEETGFRVDSIQSIGMLLTAPHFCNERVSVFVAQGEISRPPTPTPKEDLRGIIEIPPSSITQLILEGQMLDSKSISAYSLVRARGTQFGVTL